MCFIQMLCCYIELYIHIFLKGSEVFPHVKIFVPFFSAYSSQFSNIQLCIKLCYLWNSQHNLCCLKLSKFKFFCITITWLRYIIYDIKEVEECVVCKSFCKLCSFTVMIMFIMLQMESISVWGGGGGAALCLDMQSRYHQVILEGNNVRIGILLLM